MPKRDDEHEEPEVEITIVDKDFKRLESGQKLILGTFHSKVRLRGVVAGFRFL